MVQIAFPLFRQPPNIDVREMTEALARRHRDYKFKPELAEEKVDGIVVGDVSVLIMPIPSPIPGDDIARVHHFARRGWHDTSDVPEQHGAHAIVTTFGEQDPKEAAVALTLVVAEFCQSPNCLGVSWGASGVLAHSRIVTQLAASVGVDAPALPLWIDAMPYRNDAGIGLSTRGLDTFIGRELHFLPSPNLEPETIFQRAMDISEYLYANGPVILDGQSVGYSETDMIRARWTEETGDKDGEVRRWIELEIEKLDPST